MRELGPYFFSVCVEEGDNFENTGKTLGMDGKTMDGKTYTTVCVNAGKTKG